MDLFGLVSILFAVTFVTATPLDPEANYKIVDCRNVDRCWGTVPQDYSYIYDVSEYDCSLFNIADVSSFGTKMVLIQTAKDNPDCSECAIDYGGTILTIYKHYGEGVRIIKPFVFESGSAEENVCLTLWHNPPSRNIGGRPYKFVRV